MPESKERLNKTVKLSAITEAESLSERALMRSKPIALLGLSWESCFKVNCTSNGLSVNLFMVELSFEVRERKNLMPELNFAANFEPIVEKWLFKISAIFLGSEITTPSDSIPDKGEECLREVTSLSVFQSSTELPLFF